MLAGVSTSYYKKLELGLVTSVSNPVREGLCRALQLDSAERAHLTDLLADRHPASGLGAPSLPVVVLPGTQQILDAAAHAACFVINDRLDVLGANDVGRALYQPIYGNAHGAANHARFVFLDPASHEFWLDWDAVADNVVSTLRLNAGHEQGDPPMSALVSELRRRSEQFRNRWQAHAVALHGSGVRRIHHSRAGDLTLNFHVLPLPLEPSARILIYTADFRSSSYDALTSLSRPPASPVPHVGRAYQQGAVR
jgi:hypothetical protein